MARPSAATGPGARAALWRPRYERGIATTDGARGGRSRVPEPSPPPGRAGSAPSQPDPGDQNHGLPQRKVGE